MSISNHTIRSGACSVFRCATLLLFAALTLPAVAGEVVAMLVDQDGAPVDDAVIYLHSVNGQSFSAEPIESEVDQIDKSFAPYVRVVTVNSRVAFPNFDDIRHHVYSFSEAKTFELPLYIGTPANPVLFDKPGIVDLGCNIHDFMRGYVLVLETPHHARSQAGRARLAGLPAGQLDIRIWHPLLAEEETLVRNFELGEQETHEFALTLELRSELGARRAPSRRGRRY